MTKETPVNKAVSEDKKVTIAFSGDEAKVLSVVLTEFVRNMTRLAVNGRIKQTAQLEKELVIISKALDKLASADFKLRANKEDASSLGFSVD